MTSRAVWAGGARQLAPNRLVGPYEQLLPAAIGVVIWVAASALLRPGWIEILLLFAPLVVVPLGLFVAETRPSGSVRWFRLLAALFSPATPPSVVALEAVRILQQVWHQQYHRPDPAGPGEEPLRFRTGEELPAAAVLIQSPYDPEARYCTHGRTGGLV